MDVIIMRIVVTALGAVSALCVVGIVIVAASGHEPPVALVTIGTTGVGALVGILVTPIRQKDPGGTDPARKP